MTTLHGLLERVAFLRKLAGTDSQKFKRVRTEIQTALEVNTLRNLAVSSDKTDLPELI